MFCTKCGKEIADEAVVCVNCGCAVNGGKNISTAAQGEDIPNIGLNVVGFLIPIAGLIMYCTMHSKTPNKANKIGLWSLIGFVINLVLLAVMSM